MLIELFLNYKRPFYFDYLEFADLIFSLLLIFQDPFELIPTKY